MFLLIIKIKESLDHLFGWQCASGRIAKWKRRMLVMLFSRVMLRGVFRSRLQTLNHWSCSVEGLDEEATMHVFECKNEFERPECI